MADDWMPGAVKKPISYRAEAGKFPGTPLGWILHVTVSNGSPYAAFQQAQSPNRRFSNFWVSKSGVVEQYTERTGKPWAQAAGNGTYWAIETEGFPNEPLTDAQITALATIHRWLGVVDQIADAPGQPGIGTHFMGGAAWGGHTCPDPSPGGQGPRSHQRQQIITAAQEPDMPLTQADIDAVAVAAANQVWNRFKVHGPTADVDLQTALSQVLKAAVTPASDGTVDYATLATAVVNELATRGLTLQILGKA